MSGRRAGRFRRTLTKGQAQTYRDGEKSPMDGLVGWVEGPTEDWLEFDVMCGEQLMHVSGRDAGPGDVQIFVQVPEVYGNLARLCWTPCHGDDIHWHWFEHMIGLEFGKDSPAELDELSRDAMLDLFLEQLHITNLGVKQELAS